MKTYFDHYIDAGKKAQRDRRKRQSYPFFCLAAIIGFSLLLLALNKGVDKQELVSYSCSYVFVCLFVNRVVLPIGQVCPSDIDEAFKGTKERVRKRYHNKFSDNNFRGA